jgi:hypothetical protein
MLKGMTGETGETGSTFPMPQVSRCSVQQPQTASVNCRSVYWFLCRSELRHAAHQSRSDRDGVDFAVFSIDRCGGRDPMTTAPAPQPILVRPRLTDHHGLLVQQASLDFAIPFLDEDIPLYVDPFLLWKSPSQQDQALHTSITNAFNQLNWLLHNGKEEDAKTILVRASECAEVGLGHSGSRKGHRIGAAKADEILSVFREIEHYKKHGFSHFEEIQLYVRDIAQDRVSDFACSFLKSFLVDFSTQACAEAGIPVEQVKIPELYNYRSNSFDSDVPAALPVDPKTKSPLVLVPKRWLRFAPWLNFDDYFQAYCPRDEIFNPGEKQEAVRVLRYNRDHFDVVRGYVAAKERQAADCKNDPLFTQIPVTSAKKKLKKLISLPSGKTDNADRDFEEIVGQLLASLLYPELDFAKEQSRTIDGVLIRDLIFYNQRNDPFLQDLFKDYGNRQLVFELKNVAEINRDHINQLNRYLDDGIGRFGVFVTRNPLPKAMFKNTVDLWSGQRKCIIALTDTDLETMVQLFETKQRAPLDVLKAKFLEFRRACPS